MVPELKVFPVHITYFYSNGISSERIKGQVVTNITFNFTKFEQNLGFV